MRKSCDASTSVVVIGAGTVGLSCALRILEECKGAKVTVVADEFFNQTTSYGSGGLWEPYQIAGTSDEKINSWGEYAFKHFLALYNSDSASKAGVQLITCYQLFEDHEDSSPPSWKDIVFNFQLLSKETIDKMALPSKFVKGFTFGTLIIEQKYYMKYLTDELEKSGRCTFIQKKLSTLEDVALVADDRGFDAIVNCCGIGAYSLLGDEEMYPIRGQVIRVKAPWMNNCWFFGKSYIIPNVDTVVLGGTAQKGNWNTTVSLDDTNKILNDIYEIFPSMKAATIVSINIHVCFIDTYTKYFLTYTMHTKLIGECMGGSSTGQDSSTTRK